ncbi:NUMOD4 domain-containing protein [Phocaeicola plebeius]|jgi:hypothetical protein|uniref:NUMOD4 domain-containing protein n=1 Tax=Phocaeicola plebeius TaxID=310297 RepID=UPI003F7FF885
MSRLKEIEGYNGDYLISDNGEVISNKSNCRKILRKRINKRGYYYVNLCKNGKYKSVSIHRIVGKHFVDNKNNYNVLNHIDGNKLNNNYENLEWCTYSHNVKEAARLGLLNTKKGKDSNLYCGKIDIDIANRIREIRKYEHLSYSNIAKMFGLSKTTIINIVKDRIYI